MAGGEEQKEEDEYAKKDTHGNVVQVVAVLCVGNLDFGRERLRVRRTMSQRADHLVQQGVPITVHRDVTLGEIGVAP